MPIECIAAGVRRSEASNVAKFEASSQTSVTVLLSRVNRGDREALDDLVAVVYTELRRIAQAYLRRESQNNTLQPTALIHEAYLRLIQHGGASYQNRAHFYGIVARLMRQVLVDYARARHAAKRGSGLKVTLDWTSDISPEQDRTVIALDDALKALADEDEQKARLVEMHFFGGMTGEEISSYVEIPVHTVRRELRIAQAWLRREMES